jgi:hypothetical protein
VIPVAVSQADVVGWICLVVGIGLLVVGVASGLWITFRRAPKTADAAIGDAKQRLEETKTHIEETRTAATPGTGAFESFEAAGPKVATAAAAAGASADAAQSALEQVQGIVASLPENLRFAGLLILVGTVLMSVATIQFGGVSLF